MNQTWILLVPEWISLLHLLGYLHSGYESVFLQQLAVLLESPHILAHVAHCSQYSEIAVGTGDISW